MPSPPVPFRQDPTSAAGAGMTIGPTGLEPSFSPAWTQVVLQVRTTWQSPMKRGVDQVTRYERSGDVFCGVFLPSIYLAPNPGAQFGSGSFGTGEPSNTAVGTWLVIQSW